MHPVISLLFSAMVASAMLMLPVSGRAAGLDAPALPADPASAMYSLQDLYNRLDSGAAGSKRAGPFAEPRTGPNAGTMRTVDEVMAKAPKANANAAAPGDVLAGKTYWGLRANAWGKQSGAMAIQSLSAASSAMPAGYYNAGNLCLIDPDLKSENLCGRISLFGVNGDANVINTADGNVTPDDILEGKTAYANGELVTGTVAEQELDHESHLFPAGIYEEANLAEVADTLKPENIANSVAIFGVQGNNPKLVDTATANATADDLREGKKAWVNGELLEGTIEERNVNPNSSAIFAGLYPEADLAEINEDLAAGNIAAGETIFGIAGTYETTEIHATIGIPKTGQIVMFAASGDDGTLQMGVPYPNPRFSVANGDPAQPSCEIVIDYLTHLGWPYNWGEVGERSLPGKKTWADAVAACTNYHYGAYNDWHLPNANELLSLFYFGGARGEGGASPKGKPALCNAAGTGKWANWDRFGNLQDEGVRSSNRGWYWTSTTVASDTNKAWAICMGHGMMEARDKSQTLYTMPCRDYTGSAAVE